MKSFQTPPKKTYQEKGKWVERVTRSKIIICKCGNKYIKTRPDQKECLRCLNLIRER